MENDFMVDTTEQKGCWEIKHRVQTCRDSKRESEKEESERKKLMVLEWEKWEVREKLS